VKDVLPKEGHSRARKLTVEGLSSTNPVNLGISEPAPRERNSGFPLWNRTSDGRKEEKKRGRCIEGKTRKEPGKRRSADPKTPGQGLA